LINGAPDMADALFLAVSVLTIGSAIAALEMRSLVYGSIALMGTLGGVAGFYVMLDSPFVAMFQLAVYVGSIAVLILFTVMLVKRELIFKKIEDPKRKFAGIGLMLIVRSVKHAQLWRRAANIHLAQLLMNYYEQPDSIFDRYYRIPS